LIVKASACPNWPAQPGLAAQPQDLGARGLQCGLVPGPEPGDRGVIGPQSAGDDAEGEITHTGRSISREERTPWQ
jgi:hypothetical protein